MFGVDSTELLIVAVLALLFIGPKDLPHVMMKVGRWVGRVRGYARHFTAGIENVIREAELEEMEKKWRAENDRIMSLHPPDAHYPEPGTIDPQSVPPPIDVSEELPTAEGGETPHPRPGFDRDDSDPTDPKDRELP